MPATLRPTEYTLCITEDERAELLRLLEQEVADIHVECRRTEAPDYHDRLREEETLLRLLTAKVRRLTFQAA